jgi:hypothetical protein
MINVRSFGFMFFFSFILVLCLISNGYGHGISDSPRVIETDQKAPPQQKIVPSPRNPREKTGIYVFLGWVWLVIFILFYFLRLKIKELDRLYHLGFFSDFEDFNK